MKYSEMTLEEFMAWKSGDFEEYKALLTRMHWLWSHIRGAGFRVIDAEDSMSCFSEDEHEDEAYLKYKAEYEKAFAKMQKWKAELAEIEEKLVKYMKRSTEGGYERRKF